MKKLLILAAFLALSTPASAQLAFSTDCRCLVPAGVNMKIAALLDPFTQFPTLLTDCACAIGDRANDIPIPPQAYTCGFGAADVAQDCTLHAAIIFGGSSTTSCVCTDIGGAPITKDKNAKFHKHGNNK
jgi:hypothetical protein